VGTGDADLSSGRRGRAFPAVSYTSSLDPVRDMNIPLAVLVNGNTASAAEIVSGAVQVKSTPTRQVIGRVPGAYLVHLWRQDLDVGVIVGSDRTFGKGLVQNGQSKGIPTDSSGCRDGTHPRRNTCSGKSAVRHGTQVHGGQVLHSERAVHPERQVYAPSGDG
jgi:hypothetical protein